MSYTIECVSAIHKSLQFQSYSRMSESQIKCRVWTLKLKITRNCFLCQNVFESFNRSYLISNDIFIVSGLKFIQWLNLIVQFKHCQGGTSGWPEVSVNLFEYLWGICPLCRLLIFKWFLIQRQQKFHLPA